MNAREKTKFVTDKAVALIKLLHNTSIGAKEFSGGFCPERCDAILFNSYSSYMIETKISRSDFLADFKKEHRKDGCGIGNYRYYACPVGLIKPEELPEKWGLIYVDLENKRSRAKMPIGHGGWVRNPKNDTKHPKYGWTVQGLDLYGSSTKNEHGSDIPIMHSREGNPFLFQNSQRERDFLFALAVRYKNQEFMENIL